MESFLPLTKIQKVDFFLLNVQVIVYFFQYLNNIGKYVIKANQLVCDAVYLYTIAIFKQWYDTYEKNRDKQFPG